LAKKRNENNIDKNVKEGDEDAQYEKDARRGGAGARNQASFRDEER